jgi:branched-chain amino acid transport system substrate-binding protein
MGVVRRSSNLVGRAVGALLVSSCMLGNINPEQCSDHAACEQLFGLGSTCESDGYCTDAAPCAASIECRASFGVGSTCEASRCVVAPVEARCSVSEPEGLVDELSGRLGDRIVLGGMFAIGNEKHRVRADAARLAVRQVNDIAGGVMGRPLGLLVCDSDSDGDPANDEQEVQQLTSYLAETLGLPVVLGPTSSANSIHATNWLLQQQLATTLISPSATSNQLTDLADRLNPGDPHGLFWRTCPSDTLQGPVIARVIAGQMGLDEVATDLDRIAVIYQNDAYGSALQVVFRADFLELDSAGHEMAGFSFAVDQADVADAVAGANAFAPDAVLIISSDASRTVSVLQEAADAAALQPVPFFLTDGSKDASVLLAASNSAPVQTIVRRVIGTAPASPDGSSYNNFRDELRNQFDADSTQFSFVAHSYDAAFVATYGIVFAETVRNAYDGLDVAAGLSMLSAGDPVEIGPSSFSTALSALQLQQEIDIHGMSGPLDFDAATGEAPGDIEVWAVCDSSLTACQGEPVAGTDLVFEQIVLVPADSL